MKTYEVKLTDIELQAIIRALSYIIEYAPHAPEVSQELFFKLRKL